MEKGCKRLRRVEAAHPSAHTREVEIPRGTMSAKRRAHKQLALWAIESFALGSMWF
jgi:hypothetical protein